jgi:hypothetical protein
LRSQKSSHCTASVAYENLLASRRSGSGLDAAPGTDLNTNHRETPEERARRLGTAKAFFDPGTVAPPDTQTLDTFLKEIYNPMFDAKCFNDKYVVPTINKNDLYKDYKKIFDWGLANPSESPLWAESTGVTSNRFPGMCLRMAFHDNAIDVAGDGAAYVTHNIDQATGKWIGPAIMMETSGGDGSVLTCKPERFHPNQNYDQTASRVLHAFQSMDKYPQGPGIGSGQSLMSKYKISYSDALHNCALAAVRYMIEKDSKGPTLKINLPKDQLKALLSNLVGTMKFGRKDACYITDDKTLMASDDLGAASRRPLCGPSDSLPGVTLSAKGVNDWFEKRNMPVGVWLSLFGTHSALDNFSEKAVLRNFGVPDRDYFVDYVGCPYHQLHPPVTEPEDTGCDWTPTCKDPYNKDEKKWPLVQSDCATSIDIIERDASDLTDLQKQMKVYIDMPGAWIADVICALSHLGGDGESCAGPYSVTGPKKSMFGSFYKNDYPVPAGIPSTSSKYQQCLDAGYAKDACKKNYGNLRRLREVNTQHLIVDAQSANCTDADYGMFLVSRGAHFAFLATPVGEGGGGGGAYCPSVVFHAEPRGAGAELKKIALHAEPEDVAEVADEDKLHLGAAALERIVEAFKMAPVGRDGVLYDAISNNCIALLRNMADPLDIPVDERMIGFVSRKLLDGPNDHMFEMMKNSPALAAIMSHGGARRLLGKLSKEELLAKVIKLYV